MPINTDGGLMANGEPVGASGLRQIYELTQQLRGHGRRPPGPRRTPRSASPSSTARPGISGATIIST